MHFLSNSRFIAGLLGCAAVFAATTPAVQAAGTPAAVSSDHARIVAHWTPERMAAAIPRDLVIDERGQGYLRKPDGSLEPYGHTVAAATPVPMAKPGRTVDKTPPTITSVDPANGATINATSYTFKATVTDASGVRSVTFKVGKPNSTRQSFNASRTVDDVWVVSLQGFTAGDWVWNVVAKDKAGNTASSGDASFKISTSGGGGGGGSSVIANSEWANGGKVQTAAGRIYFQMPANAQRTRWDGYVCSGTVVTDSTGGRSIIQTAAHCVYDDANKAFARNVMFIPDQAATSGTGTDLNCANDVLGCWTAAFGVVDANWTTNTFPGNVQWDYAYYVVYDSGAHTPGYTDGTSNTLDDAAGSLGVSFSQPQFDVANSDFDYTHALGYSYSEDPKFMYCAEDMHQLDGANWWLGSCELSGGSSGGPWVQPMNPSTGDGPLISVNSWGYTNQPGMAGPKLWGTSAVSVFTCAQQKTPSIVTDGNAGLIYPAGCQ